MHTTMNNQRWGIHSVWLKTQGNEPESPKPATPKFNHSPKETSGTCLRRGAVLRSGSTTP
eukprot:2379556-Amphidinium_carterae.1